MSKRVGALILSIVSASAIAQPVRSAANDIGATVFASASPSVFVVKTQSTTGSSQGSGVAYRYGYSVETKKPDSTWIATNAHVVAGAKAVLVESTTGVHKASIEYADADLDIALLSVEGAVFPTAKPFGAQQAKVGSRVFAIGAPFGLQNTISEGLLSGVRDLKGGRAIQTTAAISGGSSGGGLFDADGRLLGITTFKLKGGENLNFAIDARVITVLDEALLASNLIRASYERKIVQPGDENDLDARYIESGALTSWLQKQSASDGSPLYEYVNRAVMKGDFFAGNAEFDAMLGNFLKGRPRISGSQAQTTANGSAFRLACPMFATNDRSYKFDLNLTIEPTGLRVNGRQAAFTDDTITFMTGKDAAFTAVLNRYSGRVSISSSQFASMLTGACTKVEERKF